MAKKWGAKMLARAVVKGALFGQLSSKAGEFQYFPLAFNESTDMTDIAQILVFIRGVTKYLSIHEDLLGLVSLRGTTRGLDVKELQC